MLLGSRHCVTSLLTPSLEKERTSLIQLTCSDTRNSEVGWVRVLFFLGDYMSERIPINVDELKKVFRIRNGKLERIDLRRTDGKWKVVENKSNDGGGYCRKKFNGRQIPYHVIIWILSTGEDIPQGYEIDHINGNKIDNRIENLRVVTPRGNQQNQKKHRAGQLVGCYFHKSNGKHQAQIKISGKMIYLGLYKTEQEAHEVYTIACKHITNYVDNESFRELIKNEMEGSRVGQ